MTLPMLAEFVLRLAGGLAGLLLLSPWRVVPPAFFRTHCQVALGLLVLGALAEGTGRSGSGGLPLGLTIAAAVLAYVASVAWGMGLPRLAVPLTASIVALVASILIVSSRGGPPALWALNVAGELASAALLGSTLTAMLLGHHYLTAPAMSIDPLRRFVRCMAGSLAVRAGLAALGLWFWAEGSARLPSGAVGGVSPLFLAMRWLVGLASPGLATYLAWRTVQIRSTQSATGILYIAMIVVLFGEVAALALSHQAGVVL